MPDFVRAVAAVLVTHCLHVLGYWVSYQTPHHTQQQPNCARVYQYYVCSYTCVQREWRVPT